MSDLSHSSTIAHLRASLRRSHAIVALLGSDHPEILSDIVSRLPPPPLALGDEEETKEGEGKDDALASASPSGPSAFGSKGPGSEVSGPGADDDDDSTLTPRHTEETAGRLFADARNLERDTFFKARIAHGIDDGKVFDLGPKVDCKKVVEGAVGAVGLVNVMEQYPEEEVRGGETKPLLICYIENIRSSFRFTRLCPCSSSTYEVVSSNLLLPSTSLGSTGRRSPCPSPPYLPLQRPYNPLPPGLLQPP